MRYLLLLEIPEQRASFALGNLSYQRFGPQVWLFRKHAVRTPVLRQCQLLDARARLWEMYPPTTRMASGHRPHNSANCNACSNVNSNGEFDMDRIS